MAEYLLAHDLGTSGNKATLFSTDGRLIGSRTSRYPTRMERPLWAEQDPDDWWTAVCRSTKELLAAYDVRGDEVKAVSFSGQMMGCLPVDRCGRPLRRSIIWADQRARKQAAAIEEKIPLKKYYGIVGHRNTGSYGVQKVMWVRDNEPEIYENTYKFLNAKDFITFRLTGTFATDPSDANSMGCFDQKGIRWSDEIAEAAGIDMDKLPEIRESTFCAGNVTPETAEETGLSANTRVIVGAGDGVAANVGAGCVAPGSAYCCLGTSAWVAGTSEKPVLDDQMRIVCWAHAVPGLYSPNGTMQYAGGSYKWMADTFGRGFEGSVAASADPTASEIYAGIDSAIAGCRPGAGGVIFLPYLMGERAPRWNPDAKGVFYGITASTTRGEMFRAVMEGILMNLGICFDILAQEIPIEEIMLIGGPARNDQWKRCAADMFGVDVLVPSLLEEASSMGAAVIAGIGAGIFPDFSAAQRFIEIRDRVMPDPESVDTYRTVRKSFEALYEALTPVYQR